MPLKTKIEWTDYTSNPIKFRTAEGKSVWACAKVSDGCKHCYAETLAKRYGRGGPFNATETAKLTPYLDEKELRALLTSKAISGKRVFIGDMTDIFGEWVPDDMLDRLFAVMALSDGTRATGRWVTYQLLTKRADRAPRYLSDPDTPFRVNAQIVRIVMGGYTPTRNGCDWSAPKVWPLPNVWLGVSCEDQQRADERIPLLLQTPAAVRFVSAEPLLGPIDFNSPVLQADSDGYLDWCIVGGESGHGARPMHPDWALGLRDQCASAGVPFFFKQWGEWSPFVERATGRAARACWFNGKWDIDSINLASDADWPDEDDHGPLLYRVGKHTAGHLLDGVAHREFPNAEARS